MKIKQTKSGYKHIFTFNDTTMNYNYKYSGGYGDYDIAYADFPSKFYTVIEQNDWIKNVGWLWILMGIGYNVYRLYTVRLLDQIGILFITLGVLCLIWTFFRKIKFSIYETPKGNVLIINNRKHDKIIDEIQCRRKKQLLDMYGQVDFENDIKDEIKKFEWLQKENILSNEEIDKKILEIKEGNHERIGFIQ